MERGQRAWLQPPHAGVHVPPRLVDPADGERKRRRRRHRRSSTLSPRPHGHLPSTRRLSDTEWSSPLSRHRLTPEAVSLRTISPLTGAPVQHRPPLPSFASAALRKTSSEPNDIDVDQLCDGDCFRHQHGPLCNGATLASLARASPQRLHACETDEWETPSSSILYMNRDSLTESEVMSTDIEELKVAAQSIDALERRTRQQPFAPSVVARYDSRRSGITTRVGAHPRGVMQFLPSVKTSDVLSRTAFESYMANKWQREELSGHPGADSYARALDQSAYAANDPWYLRRKLSLPDRPIEPLMHYPLLNDGALQVAETKLRQPKRQENSSGCVQRLELPTERRLSRFASFNADCQPKQPLTRQLSQGSNEAGSIKGADSLAGVSRFGRLLRSLRTTRPEGSTASSDSAPSSPEASRTHLAPSVPSDSDSSMLRADRMLWRRRSKGSLRRHNIGRLIWADSATPIGSPPTVDAMWKTPNSTAAARRKWYRLRSVSSPQPPPADDSRASPVLQYRTTFDAPYPSAAHDGRANTRTHIVKELFDTEVNYVENLQLIVHKYLRPLKRPELCALLESAIVDEIFFQIPEVLGHHELFLATLRSRLDNWDHRQKIGDIILNNFTKQSVIDSYTAFINNWKSAKQAIRNASETRPAFAKYLERCSREHRSKLSLDALLIMPVQRIPRYELLIKEMLKHTSVDHPDHALLLRAQKEIHELATKINHIEQELGLCEQMLQRLREIEAIVDGLDDTPTGRKERCMFLLSDQLIITSVKRKAATALRKASSLGQPTHDFLENHKFRMLMRISLDDLEVANNTLPLLNQAQEYVSHMQEDLRVVGKLDELCDLLKCPHEELQHSLQSFRSMVRSNLAEKQSEMCNDPVLTSLDLLVTTEDGLESFSVAFHNADKRAAWEKCFNDAKEALALSLSKKPPPLFLKAIMLQRTRAGLHFTCAAQTFGNNQLGYRDMWVCNSDGYVGQVCVLKLSPEPEVESCNGVASARIACICAVPAPPVTQSHRKAAPTVRAAPQDAAASGVRLELCRRVREGDARASAQWPFSESSDNDEGDGSTTEMSRNSQSSKSSASADGASSDAAELDGANVGRGPSMWLGTDAGELIICNAHDSVRARKNRLVSKLEAAVTSVVYVEERVFVSLADGRLVHYQRKPDCPSAWDLENGRQFYLQPENPDSISAMVSVTSRLWCSSRNAVFMVNHNTLITEHSLLVNSDTDTTVVCMVTGGLGVWLSLHSSPVIKLFHALSFECLLELNVSPIVTKSLAGCDDIIRQHKLACLRVTSLLVCKDLLWVGTSSGVVLTLTAPHLSHGSKRLTSAPPMTVSAAAHSGQCRLLSVVELHEGGMSRTGSFCGSHAADMSRRRVSLNVAALHHGKVYVMSAGDGFDESHATADDDGQQDSANHLLLWHV